MVPSSEASLEQSTRKFPDQVKYAERKSCVVNVKAVNPIMIMNYELDQLINGADIVRFLRFS